MPRGQYNVRRIWLPSFFGGATTLLVSLSILTLYFYVIGNAQGFTDETLMFLVALESWILTVGTLMGLFSILAYAVILPLRKRPMAGRFLFSVLSMVFCLLLFLCIALLRAFMGHYG